MKRFFTPRRQRIAAGAGALLIGLTFLVLSQGTPIGTAAPMSPVSTSVFRVTPRPLEQRLSLVGTIEPGAVINLTGAFDGAIKEKRVDFGSRVERGQVMLVLDGSEIELQIRDAQVVAIKAARAVEDVKGWNSNPDVIHARNAVTGGKMKVDDLTGKEKSSKDLLARGIIPRSEYDGVAAELKAENLQLDAARQDYDAILKRGDSEHRHLAELELETANKRLSDLQRQVNAGTVRAPVAGLVLHPIVAAGGKEGSPANIEIGSHVTKGQPLFTVADTDTLKVRARVDEIDINRISEEQMVTVTGDAFSSSALVGRIAQIAPQAVASESSASSTGASFEVIVALSSLTPEQQRHVRIGMSANVSILTYSNPAALVVPSNAVHVDGDGSFVLLQEAEPGKQHRAPVVVGRSVEDGVEILEGLQPGEDVLIEGGLSPQMPHPQNALPQMPPSNLNQL